MKKFLLLLFPILIFSQSYRFKKIAGGFPIGSSDRTILFDSNNDGNSELSFSLPVGRDWQIWEYVRLNRFELAYTGRGHETGQWDIDDIDQDGCWDRLESGVDSLDEGMLVLTYESPNPSSYPTEISWLHRIYTDERTSWYSYFPGDLDMDGQREIVYNRSDTGTIFIMENQGNNNNRVVWNSRWSDIITTGGAIAFGDFDQDGMMEFALSGISWRNWVKVFENTGNDQYELIFTDTITLPNGHIDAFSGNDVNQNGKPEFFINFIIFPNRFHLYMWETVGNNRYRRVCVDSLGGFWDASYLRSMCADIDADGIQEVIQSAASQIAVHKFIDGRFRRVSVFSFGMPNSCINSADLNGNGYNEIIVSGRYIDARCTDIYELETVWLFRPNRNETFRAGTQERIWWRVFQPPRCDSLSLFYSIDNGRTYHQIVTGLPGTDTIYLWSVPNVRSDSCKVKVIAYGPGWQYDESDGVFRITAVGVEEEYGRKPPKRFEIYPNPARASLTICLPQPVESRTLKIFDVVGKLIRVEELKSLGVKEFNLCLKGMKPGVYILQFGKMTKKFLVTR